MLHFFTSLEIHCFYTIWGYDPYSSPLHWVLFLISFGAMKELRSKVSRNPKRTPKQEAWRCENGYVGFLNRRKSFIEKVLWYKAHTPTPGVTLALWHCILESKRMFGWMSLIHGCYWEGDESKWTLVTVHAHSKTCAFIVSQVFWRCWLLLLEVIAVHTPKGKNSPKLQELLPANALFSAFTPSFSLAVGLARIQNLL